MNTNHSLGEHPMAIAAFPFMKTQISEIENTGGPPLPRQRILVAEGESDIRRLNSEMLIHSGYDVDTAGDGAAAWDTLQLNRYDLLITAQFLPKVSGVYLLKKMHDTDMSLPTIMTTKILPTWEFAARSWLQRTTMVRTPYTTQEFLGTVKKILRAITNAREEIAQQPNWQRHSPAIVL
jgi:DNA-binding response OmpR family regulator